MRGAALPIDCEHVAPQLTADRALANLPRCSCDSKLRAVAPAVIDRHNPARAGYPAIASTRLQAR